MPRSPDRRRPATPLRAAGAGTPTPDAPTTDAPTTDAPVLKPGTEIRAERPRMWKVVLLNDDFTPREFVSAVLRAVFRLTEDQAHRVMITAHRRGVCVVAVFTRDVAETKADAATEAGKAAGYPLRFVTEPEE